VNVSLNRIVLYVQDVDRLADFYRAMLGLAVVEEIPGEWSVLATGSCELALHRAGPAYRRPGATTESNAKIVFAVERDLAEFRAELLARGVPLGELKAYPPLTGPLCDGRDPEGNVFQLAEVTAPEG
jgi:catechol 2,3-dioxygenase-like lactoylglutathione lyase family enzyme